MLLKQLQPFILELNETRNQASYEKSSQRNDKNLEQILATPEKLVRAKITIVNEQKRKPIA